MNVEIEEGRVILSCDLLDDIERLYRTGALGRAPSGNGITKGIVDRSHLARLRNLDGGSLGELRDVLLRVPQFVREPMEFFQKLQEVRRRVCKIKVNHVPATGFLVAPGVVLTNDHVVDALIHAPEVVDQIKVYFDFSPGKDGAPDTGEVYTLAKKWKIGFSGTSAADNLPEPRPIEAGLDELDYALLRLESAPGEERGIIEVPHELPALEAPMALCCIQYPIDSASVSPSRRTGSSR